MFEGRDKMGRGSGPSIKLVLDQLILRQAFWFDTAAGFTELIGNLAEQGRVINVLKDFQGELAE